MKKHFILPHGLLLVTILFYAPDCFGQANINLSNLGPTSINQNLLPTSNNSRNLGSSGKSWKELFVDGNIYLDDAIFITNRNVINNTFIGNSAGNVTIGNSNTGIGYQSMLFNFAGAYNTAVGQSSLLSNTSGSFNSAFGVNALYTNTTGGENTALGYQALNYNTSGSYNTAIGLQAMFNNTSSSDNVAIGYKASFTNTTGLYNCAVGSYALYSNMGDYNVGIGYSSLRQNVTGFENTAVGNFSMQNNYSGYYNTAIGQSSLMSNYNGVSNTALGYTVLTNNTTGIYNTASGSFAMVTNTSGSFNIASGVGALFSNTTGNNNTGMGTFSLYYNSTGNNNTATGYNALYLSGTGSDNTAIGSNSLWINSSGSDNTGVGSLTLNGNVLGNGNTAIGKNALLSNHSGSYNTAVGNGAFSSGTTFTNSTAIGYNAQVLANNQMYMGDASVTGVYCFSGLFTSSDQRFKVNVEESVPGLEFIKKLRPVQYNYDMDNIAQYLNTPDSARLKESEALKGAIMYSGFIAQEVEQAAQELNYDFSGISKPKNSDDYYALNYAEFVVPLVQAVKDLDSVNEKLQETNQLLELRIERLEELLYSKMASESNSQTGILTEEKSVFLGQNTPNPVNSITSVEYFVPSSVSSAQLIIQNYNGTLIKEFGIKAGYGSVSVDVGQLSIGAYTYSLILDGKIAATKTMAVVR